MNDKQKVKQFQELLKVIIMVNSRCGIEEMRQTEVKISDSMELNYALYLLKKVEDENPNLSFEQNRDIAMKQVYDLLKKNKKYEIEI
jgi:hypothetical protein